MLSFEKDFPRKYVCAAAQIISIGQLIHYSRSDNMRIYRGKISFDFSRAGRINPLHYILNLRNYNCGDVQQSIARLFNTECRMIKIFNGLRSPLNSCKDNYVFELRLFMLNNLFNYSYHININTLSKAFPSFNFQNFNFNKLIKK